MQNDLMNRLYSAMGKLVIYYTKCEASCRAITNIITNSNRGDEIQYNKVLNNEQKIKEYKKYIDRLNEPQRSEYDAYLQDLDNYRELRNYFAHASWTMLGNSLIGSVTDRSKGSPPNVPTIFRSDLETLEVIGEQLKEMNSNLSALSILITLPNA
ncbi:MAG: hypothetical protein DI538_10140 [Azospira oryzae]|nr:MAG: hypothetical protein DI538_10140 [Azospira oryzae]